MPGSSYSPLDTAGTYSEVDRFRDAAKEGDPVDKLIGLVLIDTGIRNSAMAHMRPDWVRTDRANPEIIIPRTENCRLGKGEGKGGNTRNTTEPCYQCRHRPIKDWLKGSEKDTDWHPKTKAGAQRTIPIRDDDTIDILKNYFNVYDTVQGVHTVSNRVHVIAERAEFEREVSPHDLRDTYGTRLAVKGFSPYDIREFMGHENIQQALDYIKLSGAQAHQTYDDKW